MKISKAIFGQEALGDQQTRNRNFAKHFERIYSAAWDGDQLFRV